MHFFGIIRRAASRATFYTAFHVEELGQDYNLRFLDFFQQFHFGCGHVGIEPRRPASVNRPAPAVPGRKSAFANYIIPKNSA
jgi:hypothetical protein